MRANVIVAISCTGLLHLLLMHFALLEEPSSTPSRRVTEQGIDWAFDNKLRVAWLMSYPNSGTSFTVHLIRTTTNRTTGTNYGWQDGFQDKQSVPVFDWSRNGPFVQETKPSIPTTWPQKYIMTKTHCGGYCYDCKPFNYLHTTQTFKEKCLTGNRAKINNSEVQLDDGLVYSSDLVKKAIHIYRHPLDNIVARFHLTYKSHQTSNDTEWTTEYPNSVTGFHRWCRMVDSLMPLGYLSSVARNSRMAEILMKLPCMVEFFRYAQWHNLANSMVHEMGIPSLTIHYEAYRKHEFEESLKTLLGFLELPHVQPGEPFLSGKEYRHYYDDEQKNAVRVFLERLSSPETWEDLKRYYPIPPDGMKKTE